MNTKTHCIYAVCMAFIAAAINMFGVFANSDTSIETDFQAVNLFQTALSQKSDAETAIASGECGENLTWTLDGNGILTIDGTGDMEDYSISKRAPWEVYYNNINTIVISEGVTTIGSYAFYSADITSIELPDSVSTIGAFAFAYSDLQQITIHKNVAKIAQGCFFYCQNLSKVYMESEETEFDFQVFEGCPLESAGPRGSGCDMEFDWETKIPAFAFCECAKLMKITIPDGIVSIGDSAIRGCKGLTSIELPDSVTRVGVQAFSDCSSLQSIAIPDGVDEMKMYTFYDCSALRKIVLPTHLNKIAYGAFYNCSALEEMSIPNTIADIDSMAFEGCTSLQNIYVDRAEGIVIDAPWSAPNAEVTYLRKMDIQPSSPQSYTGREITPVVISECRLDNTASKTLIEGTDYKVAYRDNIDIGMAAAGITYINDYANLYMQAAYFEIIPKSGADLTIEPIPQQMYSGRPITPELTIKNF